MNNIQKIIKINTLAIIALPILLLATSAKLLAKGMEKIFAIVGTLFLTLGVMILFEVMKNIDGAIDAIIMIAVLGILMGIFAVVGMFVMSLIVVFVKAITKAIIQGLDMVYAILYGAFAKMFHICQSEYGDISDMKPAMRKVSCIFYLLLWGMNKGIVFFVKNAIVIMSALGATIVIGGILLLNAKMLRVFGINIISFISMFSTFEVIYGVTTYCVFTVGLALICFTLGSEWNEWGRSMENLTENYEKTVAEYDIHKVESNEDKVVIFEDAV